MHYSVLQCVLQCVAVHLQQCVTGTFDVDDGPLSQAFRENACKLFTVVILWITESVCTCVCMCVYVHVCVCMYVCVSGCVVFQSTEIEGANKRTWVSVRGLTHVHTC